MLKPVTLPLLHLLFLGLFFVGHFAVAKLDFILNPFEFLEKVDSELISVHETLALDNRLPHFKILVVQHMPEDLFTVLVKRCLALVMWVEAVKTFGEV